jgi:hypothetical protein
VIVVDVLLDTNVYDLLREDSDTRERLTGLVGRGAIRVVVTPKVNDELRAGPFAGCPTWFPVTRLPESVAVLGHARLGAARLGEGRVYTAHRGASRKVADAIIADSASSFAAVAVSEDGRFRKRLAELNTPCRVMNYDDFRWWLLSEERAVQQRDEADEARDH